MIVQIESECASEDVNARSSADSWRKAPKFLQMPCNPANSQKCLCKTPENADQGSQCPPTPCQTLKSLQMPAGTLSSHVVDQMGIMSAVDISSILEVIHKKVTTQSQVKGIRAPLRRVYVAAHCRNDGCCNCSKKCLLRRVVATSTLVLAASTKPHNVLHRSNNRLVVLIVCCDWVYVLVVVQVRSDARNLVVAAATHSNS